MISVSSLTVQKIPRVYVTKFLGVQIDSQLSWKMHINYNCKTNWSAQLYCCKPVRCLENVVLQLFIIQLRTNNSSIVTMFGVTLTIQKLMVIQKKMVHIITGSPYQAHTELLFYANGILNVYDLNVNVVAVFMYRCLFEPVTDVSDNHFCTNRDVHGWKTRNADALYVPYGRLDVRRSSIKVHNSDLWNTLPPFIHNSESSNVFKIRIRNYLIVRKVSTWCEKFTHWGFLNILINAIFSKFKFLRQA